MDLNDAKRNVELFHGKTKQFIFISTVCVLDRSVSCNIDEKTPYGNEYSLYGQNKQACEEYFLEEYEKGFPVTIVRPTQTYSDSRYPLSVKGKSYWSIASRMLQGKEVIVHGDGQGVWACSHADDFARLFLPLVCNESTIGEIYQVMDPRTYTWDTIYRALADAIGGAYKPVYISEYLLDASKAYDLRSSIHGDKHFSCIFDISKVKAFSPDVTLDVDIYEGARRYAKYMEEHPDVTINIESFPYDEYESKVQTALMSKEGGADIYELWGGWGVDYAPSGALAQLPEDMEADVREKCYPNTYGALEADGVLFGIPMEYNIECGGLVVNNNLMKEAGVSVPATLSMNFGESFISCSPPFP